MPDGFHVDPDLVGAPRFQAKPDEGAAEIVPVIETPVMGDGVFPMIHIDAAFDGGTIFSSAVVVQILIWADMASVNGMMAVFSIFDILFAGACYVATGYILNKELSL